MVAQGKSGGARSKAQLEFVSESEEILDLGIQFEGLSKEARDLVMRFIRKRPPIFYDV